MVTVPLFLFISITISIYFSDKNPVNSNSGAKLLIAARKSQGPSGDACDNLWRITSRRFALGQLFTSLFCLQPSAL